MTTSTQTMIQNPILPGFNPDPSIVAVGDDFYIATSTFEWYPGVQIHHSKDLKNWRLLSRPLNREALLDLRGEPDSCGVWAPCLSYHDGLFYLIYTDVKRFDGNFKDAHNYLTTCDTIDGEWSDPIYMNSSGFDPSLFHDDDGKKWFVNMVWDHRHQKNRFGGILLQEYCPVKKQLVGEIKNIFAGSKLACTEAPHLYKRNGYYYLITAEGGTFYTHAMTVARSRNIDGPYELDPYGYLLTAKDNQHLGLQRTGHGDLFETPNGETYLVHLCGRPLLGERRCPLGRETGLQKTYWTEDDWLRVENAVTDGLPEMLVPAPNMPEHPWPATKHKHDFDTPELPIEFQWLRTPNPERLFSLSARPGYMRLIGRESIGSLYEHALVARRQQAFAYSAQTAMEFSPTNFQQTAGLICYYNSNKFHYCYVSIDDEGNRFVDVMSCLGNQDLTLTFGLREGHTDGFITDPRFLLPNQGPVYLRADVDHHLLTFSFSVDEKHWTKLPINLDYTIISDEAGGGDGCHFTGGFVGMACQDVSGQQCKADFDYFEYIEC
ncbi:glycoside hydrolase family 43 protein [Aliiglaciecola sp. 2_MG-2023]|uniref:glycoside hydrolase family 43 protein n=1 Tax=Alteromonadaceae TaxID=72275 RepID=UPI0026E3A0E4|nr:MULTISPECIES: glycoside hydrolase family 43 protein [unclassified Aliiglaciecola]MDO6710829.1 glycoside hydrolase family 43 protein [Aliiglaciecola sp. 2_MG-2023]MDO6751763.1 glycoside hydrolase family 43 protein [Aliiglaciecola sp. 1_MG-2023]